MLLKILFANLLLSGAVYSDGQDSKPYIFPIPLELPNRNDRSDQCWIRIEDVEVVETVTVYCYVANAFLRTYIRDYNSRKMTEDDVNVSLWSEEPRSQEEQTLPKIESGNGQKTIKDWKMTTLMDPITRMRLYVSQKADCRLVMYSREGMTNYKVDCDRILYFVNDHMYGSTGSRSRVNLLTIACVFLFFFAFK